MYIDGTNAPAATPKATARLFLPISRETSGALHSPPFLSDSEKKSPKNWLNQIYKEKYYFGFINIS